MKLIHPSNYPAPKEDLEIINIVKQVLKERDARSKKSNTSTKTNNANKFRALDLQFYGIAIK